MGAIDDIKSWLATEASDEQRSAIERDMNPPGGLLAALNAVAITGRQMRAAIEAIQHVQIRTEADVIEHGRLLAAFASEYGFKPAIGASSALHARAIAMDLWCQQYDPYGQTDIDAFFEAGGRCPLIETDKGVTFDPQVFAELVEYIAEMPF
jgi:hypothetical protein